MTDKKRPYDGTIEPFESEDGSYSLVDRERDLYYSSTHGAADEARHVFVEGTALLDDSPPWHVLEFGFGGGVNFVETVRAITESDESGRLVYHGVEHRPVSADLVEFHPGPSGDLVRQALTAIRESDGEQRRVTIESDDIDVELHLHAIEWLDFEHDRLLADAVYFDPFGPNSQPDAWTTKAFDVARRHIADQGRLATYSAATRVKRALFEAGFAVASAPGAGPKREMTVASPDPTALGELELLRRTDYVDEDS